MSGTEPQPTDRAALDPVRSDIEAEFADQMVLPAPWPERESADPFAAEDLEDQLEGIGPPQEDILHDVEALDEALLDEGGSLDDVDEDPDAVEWAVDDAIETGKRPR